MKINDVVRYSGHKNSGSGSIGIIFDIIDAHSVCVWWLQHGFATEVATQFLVKLENNV